MTQLPSSSSFTPGDIVWVPQPLGQILGRVKEDRGPLGLEGEHLYVVEASNRRSWPRNFLVRASEISKLTPDEQRQAVNRLEISEVKQYLVQGGLAKILSRFTDAIRNRPKIWLEQSSDGKVTHSFRASDSGVGGDVVPRVGVKDGKIFKPDVDEVTRFIQSFGLSLSDAEEVISRVGTFP